MILHNLFQKIEEEETSLNLFYDVALARQPGKDSTKNYNPKWKSGAFDHRAELGHLDFIV